MEEYSNNLSTTLSTDHGHSGYDYEGYEYDYGYYDYNYTYTEAIDYLPLTQIVPVSLVYGLIGITGIIGNTLVIFAIAKVQRMRSITNLFLLSLASADLLLVVVCVPVKISLLLAILVPISAIINQFNSVYEKPIQQAIFTHNRHVHARKKSARGRSIQLDENHDAPHRDAKLERLGLLGTERTLLSLSKPHDDNTHGTGINNGDSASTKSHTAAFLLDNVDALNNFSSSVSDADGNLKNLRRVRDTSALGKSNANGSPQSATYDITHLSSMCPFADICDIQGREVQEKNTDSCCLPCSCTPTCGQIGNCCDKQQNIGNMCRYPVVRSEEFLHAKDSLGFKYFIVDKCLDGTNRDCKEMKAASWGALDPVYDPVSQMNYYNPQCAKCNGVEEVTKWELTLVYRGIVKNENIRKALRGEVSKECMVKFTPPKTMNIKKNVCPNTDLIDRCNVIGTWKNYDVALEEACLRWHAPVIAKKGPMLFAFENKYCEICNNGYFEPDEVCKAIKPGRSADGFSNVFTIDYRQVSAIVDKRDDDWLMSVESDRCGQDMVKHISKGIAFFSYTWRLGEFMCKFVAYIQTVSMICSALTLMAMSIERFVAIRYPLRARSLCTVRHARIVIIAVWTSAFLLSVPMITGIEFKTVEGLHRTAYWCHKIWTEKPMYGKVFELYMLLIILVIPVSVMLVTYTWIAHIIWRVASRRADMRSGRVTNAQESHVGQTVVPVQTNGAIVLVNNGTVEHKTSKTNTDDDKTRKQVVLMLIVVVILFAVCWTPILVNNVLVAFKVIDYLHMGKLKTMRMAFHLMSYANSCLNPFVYAFMSKNFREGFTHAICACVKGTNYVRKQISARSMTSTFITRASQSNFGDTRKDSHSDTITTRRPSDISG